MSHFRSYEPERWESHSSNFEMFVEIIPFVLQGELADPLTGVAGGFTEGDAGAGLAFAYAKGNNRSSQVVREVPVNTAKFNARFT